MGIDNSLPNPHQIEVTLFGPGYGESILIHIGSNKWVIVDSCIEPKSKKPAAIQYLTSRGIDPADAVILVVATHWHDDHIRGLNQVVEICRNARFSCPLAFGKQEFIAAVSRFNKNNRIAGGSGVQELWKIYQQMSKGRIPKLASAGMVLTTLAGQDTAHGLPIRVEALSPSDHQVDKFLLRIARDLPQFRTTKFRAVSHTPNESALVILVQIGDLGLLLGADLEEENDQNFGWSAIVANRDALHPKASIYKVAHHGSRNAHHDQIWTDLLIGAPFAIVTPWNKAGGLPRTDDIKRLTLLTPNGYITSSPNYVASQVKRDAAVERTIQQTVGKKLRRAQPSFGVIRLRTLDDKHAGWSVDLSEKASSLNTLIEAA